VFSKLSQLIYSDKTLIRYLIVGVISFVSDFFLFVFFFQVLGIFYLCSATLSFIFATTINFYLSKNFAFKGMQKFSSVNTFGLVFLVSSSGLIINMTCLYLLYEWLLINIFISKILAAGSTFAFNYSLRKFLIFKHN